MKFRRWLANKIHQFAWWLDRLADKIFDIDWIVKVDE